MLKARSIGKMDLGFCTITIVLLLSLTTILNASEEVKSTVTIDTPSGQIKGIKTIARGTQAAVFQFRNVPFAKPPVNDLRFKNPEPYGKWDGILDATEFGPSCMQPYYHLLDLYELPNKDFSEDCLFLNIYVPHTLSKGNNLPVMIFVHGGGYSIGSGMFYQSSTLSTFGDVIVVTINYRLGIFGFFSLGTDVALGNFGLWDQKMAFEWVHDNIAAFGGDPNRVTIFGESAGGYSVSFHSLIASNNGLFQRVIAQSGTSHVDYAVSKNSTLVISKDFGRKVGCKMTDDLGEEYVSCLRQIPAENISTAANIYEYLDTSNFNMSFLVAPVVDGVLIKDLPSKLLSDSSSDVKKFFYSLDIMAGVTSHEGSLLYMMLLPGIQENYGFNLSIGIPTNVVCDKIGKSLLITMIQGLTPETAAAVCEHYTDTSSLERQSMRAIDLLGDVLMVTPAIKAVNLHSAGSVKSNTYYYRFSRIAPVPLMPPPAWFKGSGHGDELGYVFGEDMVSRFTEPVDITDDDRTVSYTLMRYWSNFAKSGNPNKPESDEKLVEWPTYDKENQRYIDLDVQCTTHKRPSEGAAKLWLEVIPELLKKGENRKREEL